MISKGKYSSLFVLYDGTKKKTIKFDTNLKRAREECNILMSSKMIENKLVDKNCGSVPSILEKG